MRRLSLLLLLVLVAPLAARSEGVGAQVAAAPRRWMDGLLRLEVVTVGGRAGERVIGCGVWTTQGVYTAWHVVEDAAAVTVITPAGDRHAGLRWWRLGRQDAAVVRLSEPLALAGVPVALEPGAGGNGVVMGYFARSWETGRQVRVEGWLGARVGAEGGQDRIGSEFRSFDGPFQCGMSGGPVLVGGVLVGLVSHTDTWNRMWVAPVDLQSVRRGQAPGLGAGRMARPDPGCAT